MNIFSSIKILDLTRVFSGPFATRHFSDFGAEVIKIESLQGDDSRSFPPLVNNWSGYFEVLNRNKKSLILNLKNEIDLKKFYKLCESCDVVVENFSSEVKRKLKIDYTTVKKINPKIIYASISGVSDRVNRKYYDVIAQAESGLISLNGEKEDMKISTSVVDAFSGMKLAYAISSALYSREKNKEGCSLNVSMKGAAFDLLEQNLITSSLSHKNPKKVGNMDNAIAPFGVFKAKNGNVVIAVGNENQWQKLSHFLLKSNPKFKSNLFSDNIGRIKNIEKLKSEIESVLKKYSFKEVISIFNKLDIPCGPVNTMRDVLADQENYDEGLLERVMHSVAGKIVVPTGGIFFSNHKKVKYRQAPSFSKKYGI